MRHPDPDGLGNGCNGAGTQSSRDRLLDVAEDLFGRKGVEGVSLREIASAAGQRNNSAVRYHFRDKTGLISALLSDRFAKVERLRKALVREHEPLEERPAETILRLMWEPLLTLKGPGGSHSFVRFMLAYLVERTDTIHPIVASPDDHPASGRILSALNGCYPELPQDRFQYRMGLVAMMFWAAVSQHDQALAEANQRWSSRFSIDETIRLCTAALAAPA